MSMITRRAALAAAAAAAAAGAAQAAQRAPAPGFVRHRTIKIGGVDLFYREAGPADAPPLLLLHGFPSSSFMFRDLLARLSDRFRLVAPDYPGFGHSALPPRAAFEPSFASYARLVGAFADAVALDRFALYVHDYGAPIGFRLALAEPQRIRALVVQNGNAYEEGLGPAFDALKAHWRAPSAESRERLRAFLTAEGIKFQYAAGLPPELSERLSPDAFTLDWALMNRPERIDLNLDLFGDYASNVALYPEFQAYFREARPPALILWGRRDPFFAEAGATAFLRDLPEAELHLLDAGHFALETHAAEAAALIRTFLKRR
jgi:pimeloyl-ACP methyl ester carboxylesterase